MSYLRERELDRLEERFLDERCRYAYPRLLKCKCTFILFLEENIDLV